MKQHWFSLVVGLSPIACGDSPKDERGNGSRSGMTGGSSGAGGSSGGGMAGSAAGSGSGGAASECNILPADGPDYEVTYEAGPAPVGEGGTVVDGTYFATSEIWYDMPPGPSVILGGIHVELAGNIWQEADGWPPDDVGAPEYRLTRFMSTLGTSLILTQSCPNPGSLAVFEYTAEGDSLTLYALEGGLSYGITFTRQ